MSCQRGGLISLVRNSEMASGQHQNWIGGNVSHPKSHIPKTYLLSLHVLCVWPGGQSAWYQNQRFPCPVFILQSESNGKEVIKRGGTKLSNISKYTSAQSFRKWNGEKCIFLSNISSLFLLWISRSSRVVKIPSNRLSKMRLSRGNIIPLSIPHQTMQKVLVGLA